MIRTRRPPSLARCHRPYPSKKGARPRVGERQLALCARAKGGTTNGALSYSSIFRMIASGASPNELQRLSPNVRAFSNGRKNWCRPPHSPQIGTLGAERTPVRCSRTGYCPLAGRKQHRFRSRSVIGVSPCLLGNTGEAQEKRAPAVWGVAPLCAAPACEGPSPDTGNLASTRHRGRSTVRLIPVIPNVLGGADAATAIFVVGGAY